MGEIKTNIKGYEIKEQIYSGTRTLVYRGFRRSDSQPVVIKMVRNELPRFSEIVQFRNQYVITKNLDIPNIVKPYSMEIEHNRYALIMEDFGGISLSSYLEAIAPAEQKNYGLPLGEFLPIAIQIAEILDGLYRHRVIHKDIKPANILINPQTKQVKLIDFSIASVLPRETQLVQMTNVLEGTLPYLSPEQTGRMNRGVDYRTDFYSLGVTFYELLAGELPFASDDPIELIHCHLAKEPVPLHHLKETIPPVLSDLVAKLMAKNAEDRYQSATGLKHDLEICWRHWQAVIASGSGGTIVPDFPLGERDICDRFTIPEKLYGRETEVQTLLDAFDAIASIPENPASSSNSKMMLVAGFSGVGKTAVINEIHKPIVRQRGYFIKGKFDQFGRNVPWAAFVQAFRLLMKQLLSETDAKIEAWKRTILATLGENAQVIIEVIPELEMLIGPQPRAAELSGTAAQNRFHLLFQKFIRLFATPEHPLVIFLDDLQWADSASLDLIKVLMTDSGINHLLLIGAYRDNAVHPGHPLMLTLAQIQKSGANINTLTLAPLQQSDVNRLIADTLLQRRSGTATDKVAALAAPLTELVYQKTKGNPFFITQFLKSLYEDGIIRFVPPAPDSPNNGGGWQCDISKVRELALTDDVVEFVALQLQKLPAATQEVLKLAACIGHQFDLNTLAIVLETSPSATAADLWKALQDGLVQPTSEVYKLFQEEEIEMVGELLTQGRSGSAVQMGATVHNLGQGTFNQNATYQFLHDRVQQAAYALIPPPLKKATHLKIGQLLLHNTPAAESEDKIFDTVNQLNYGIDLITAPPERLQLAELNLKCGRKAKNATAYSAASTYLSIGRQLLTPDAWQTQYEIALHLHVEGADAAYLSSSFSQMEELGQIVLENATNLLDKVKIYEIQLAACTAQMQPQTAVEIGLQVLQLLGVTFPTQPTPSDVERELGQTAAMFADKHIPDLLQLQEMTEPEKLAALRILSSLVSPTYISAPLLLPLVIVKMVHLSVTYGNAPLSSFAYGLYGLVLTGIILDIDTGYQFGELALNILERFHANYLKTKIFYTVGVHIIYGKHHVKEIIPLLKEGYARGLETGELELGYSAKEIAQYSYLSGAQLADLETDVAGYCQALAQFKQADALNYTRIVHQVLLNLLGSRKNPCDLAGAVYDEQQMLPFHLQAKDGTGLHFLYFHKMLLCYLFEQPEEAFENARQAEQYLGAVTGQLNVPLFSFYDSLVRLAICGLGQAADHTTQLEAVQTNQEKLQKWAEHAPMNFRHKWKLVQAEIYRVQGDKLAAIEAYDNAIALAQEYEYLNDEALACELAAKFYLKWGKPKIASAYLMDAYYAYARWGAAAKIEDLENRYPLLLASVLQQHQQRQNLRETLAGSGSVSSTAKTITGSTATSEILDLPAIIKASQALSSEIHLNQLLANLMEVTLENAGADAGALILKEEDSWVVAIHCTKLQNCLFQSLLADQSQVVPLSVVNYVKHAKETLVFDDATAEGKFAADPYMIKYQPKSVLCTPIRDRGKVKGILYLENKLTVGAFTRDRVQLLNILVAQAAISLENARLYRQSQEYAQKLEHSLHNLQEMQLQLVQSEKMSALGNLVAGVAHEINNPLGFLAGNLQPARDYVRDLFGLIDLYQEQFPEPGPAIASEIAAIDLEYLREDLPSLLGSMNAGVERIRHISDSLRIFSRSDTDLARPSNLHDGINSTLLILKHRLKATEQRPAIQVVKDYGDLPLVECFLGQLNQVFMNLLANAIDAIEESNQGRSFSEIKAHPNQIKIKTALNPDGDSVSIRIRDNGTGMSEAVKQKIFDHLFTTKTVGKGTGLGLSIVRQIIVEKHGGKIEVHSTLGQGAEFVITIPVRLSHPTEVQD